MKAEQSWGNRHRANILNDEQERKPNHSRSSEQKRTRFVNICSKESEAGDEAKELYAWNTLNRMTFLFAVFSRLNETISSTAADAISERDFFRSLFSALH